MEKDLAVIWSIFSLDFIILSWQHFDFFSTTPQQSFSISWQAVGVFIETEAISFSQ
jgi:hypothetical protein